MRTDIFGGLLAAGVVVLLCTGLSQDSTPPAKPGTFSPAAPQEQLMKWHERAAKELKSNIDDKKEEKAAAAAYLLAELANVNYFHRDDPKYHEFATQLKTLALDAAKALEKKDLAAADELNKKIGKTCEACHDAFGN